jgi:hypothetical protein
MKMSRQGKPTQNTALISPKGKMNDGKMIGTISLFER